MRFAKSNKNAIMFIPTLVIALQLGLFTSAKATEKVGRPVPLTHNVKAQLIDICEALGEGDMPSFKGGRISNRAMVFFCYTYAMMHTPANVAGSDRLHVPAAEMQRIAYNFFGVHFINTPLDRKGDLPVILMNGFYDGHTFDPDRSPGGYRVVKIVPLGHQLYKASVNSYDANLTNFTKINLTLRQSTAGGKAHFIVIDYSGDAMNGTNRG